MIAFAASSLAPRVVSERAVPAWKADILVRLLIGKIERCLDTTRSTPRFPRHVFPMRGKPLGWQFKSYAPEKLRRATLSRIDL